MQVLINGEARQVPDAVSVEALLKHLGYEPKSIAVAINGEFVSRNRYTLQTLSAHQELDIVAPMQGG